MLGVFAEFETNLRRERQTEGIVATKHRGAYRGRTPKIDMSAIKAKLTEGPPHKNRPVRGGFPRYGL